MLTSKKQEKLEKALGKELISELEALSTDQLKARIASAEGAVKTARDELDANAEFQELKESLKAVSAGMREVTSRQRKIVEFSLHLLEEIEGAK